MEIEEKNDEQIASEINKSISEMESKYRWRQCSFKGREFLIPDTTAALGHDVFDVSRFECHDPDPTLMVLAYPMRYRNNPTLAHLYSKRMPYGMVSAQHEVARNASRTSKRMPYGMVSAGYSIRIGMIENGEVKDGE